MTFKGLGNKLILFIIGLALTLTLFACAPKENYDIPTQEYYLNDSAHAFLNSTKWYLYINGEHLYDKSNDESIDPGDRGIQIVFVTYYASQLDFRPTDVFNIYAPGDNDLGLMIFLSFDEEGETLVSINVEIGLGMMNHISAFEMNDLVEWYYGTQPYDNIDFDTASVYLQYHLIDTLGDRMYGWSPEFVFEEFLDVVDDYDADKYEYIGPLPSERRGSLITVDPQVYIWVFVGIVVLVVVLGKSGLLPILLSLVGIGTGNRGGGGKSGGYGFRK